MSNRLALPTQMTLRVAFDSDWHIGSGAGARGLIDRAVQRDREGFPYVPAKTLRGDLRTAAEIAARALDGGLAGAWTRWADWLLGEQPSQSQLRSDDEAASDDGHAPLPSQLALGAARYSDGFRSSIGRNTERLDALTTARPGVRIDYETGTAMDDHLRFIEVARAGSILGASLTTTEPLPPEACCLLAFATQLCTHIGGKRRRGLGRCSLTLHSADGTQLHLLSDAVNFVRESQSVGEPPAAPATPVRLGGRATGSTMLTRRALLTITCHGPVLSLDRRIGNTVYGRSFLPGASLIPTLDKAWGSAFRRHLAAGGVQVGEATVAIDGRASFAAPSALSVPKHTESGVARRSWDANRGELKSWKALRDAYVGAEAATLPTAAVRADSLMHVATHNTVNDELQRPAADEGGVYSYRAIASGRVLISEVRLSEEAVADLEALGDEWWRLADGRHRVGASRVNDYGDVQFEVSSPTPIGQASAASVDPDDVVIWFTSDTIVVDERLRPSSTLPDVLSALEKVIGCAVSLVGTTPSAVFMANSRRETWSTAWGLPRPTLCTISAGSVLRIRTVVPPPDLEARLNRLQTEGLGLRRGEGFGRVVINPAILRDTSVQLDFQPRSVVERTVFAGVLNDGEQQLVDVVTAQQVRTVVARRVTELLTHADGAAKLLGSPKKASSSQLGTVRSLFTNLDERGREPVLNWLATVRQHRTKGIDQWGIRSLDRLQDYLESDERIWLELGLTRQVTPLRPTASQRLEAVGVVVTAAAAALQRDAGHGEDRS